MDVFVQDPNPLDSLGLSFVVAILPLVVLFVAVAKLKVVVAAVLALATALIVATTAFRMPVGMAFLAAAEGAIVGLWPIGYIVLMALFIYDLAVATSSISIVKNTLTSVTRDRRLLALLIGYGFGGFIEGASGFSTPVALASAMLIGVGFSPLDSAGIALICNTLPVSFGAVGTPVAALSGVVGIPATTLARAVGRLQLLPSFFVPFWISCVAAGSLRRGLEVWPACLVVAIVYTGSRTVITEFVGPQPVAVVGSLSAMAALVVLLRAGWAPSHPMDPAGDRHDAPADKGAADDAKEIELSAKDPALADGPAPATGEGAGAAAEATAVGTPERAVAPQRDAGGDAEAGAGGGDAERPATPPSSPVAQPEADPAAGYPSPAFMASVVGRMMSRGRGIDTSSIAAALFPTLPPRAPGAEPLRRRARALARATQLHLTLELIQEEMAEPVAAESGTAAAEIRAEASSREAGMATAVARVPFGGVKAAAGSEAAGATATKDESGGADSKRDAEAAGGDPEAAEGSDDEGGGEEDEGPSTTRVARAWSVWAIVAVLVVVWALEPVQAGLAVATVSAPLEGLHRKTGVVPAGTPGAAPSLQPAVLKFAFLGATGTCLLLAALISAPILGAGARQTGVIFLGTLRRVALSLVTIALLLSLAFVIRRSGADGTLGLAFAETGPAFPFVSPIVGWLGVALTGSSTSSNVLFGSMQRTAALTIGLDPIVTVAASAGGGPLGGMISLQSVVVAAVATQGAAGATGARVTTAQLLHYTIWHSTIAVILFGLWTLLLANVASAPASDCYTALGVLDPAATSTAFLSSC